VRALLLAAALTSCATTLQRRADGLGSVRLDVRWADGPMLVPVDTGATIAAFGKGVLAASAANYLPFGIDPTATQGPALAVTLGPPLVWDAGHGVAVIELPVTAVVRDDAGTELDRRVVPCFDEGVPGREVLVADDFEAVPPQLQALRVARGKNTGAAWEDLGRAWSALSEWCGGKLVENMARELK
jgi:hypothetical protein